MNHIPEITFNIILFGLLGGLGFLGFLFGENRLKNVSYGAFIAFFILLVSSETAMSDLSTKTSLPITSAKLAFVALICGLLFLGSLLSQKKAKDKIRSIPLAILTSLFIASFGVSLLAESARESLVTDFNLAAQAYNFRFIFMIALTIWLIIIQLIPQKKEEEKK